MRRIGKADEAFAYDEFGVSLSPESNDGFGFVGYLKDEISGTYFAQAREYLPEIGRFAGKDILKGYAENPQSLNEYVYCHSNPMTFVDFNGMEEEEQNANQNQDQDQDYIAFTIGYMRNQGASIAIAHTEITIEYGVKSYALISNYRNEYAALKGELQILRQQTGNAQAGVGTLGLKTKRYNAAMSKLKNEQALAYSGKVSELSARNIGMAGLKSGVIGGVTDTAFGLYDDACKGTSTSKAISNAGVNFAFGAGEGALIGMAFALTPGFGLAAIVVVWACECFFDPRQKAKDLVNSLD